MKYLSYRKNGRAAAAVLLDDQHILDLRSALGDEFSAVADIVAAGPRVWDAVRTAHADPPPESVVELGAAELLAPIPAPVRLRDCTLFTEHIQPAFHALARKRAAAAPDPEAEYQRMLTAGECDLPDVLTKQFVYYNGDHLSVSGPGQTIVAPPTSKSVDYELEFAAVLGTGGRDIPERTARQHIFGYCIFNDWSARDVQSEVMKSTLGPAEGKDFDGSNTLGPYLVTADEVGDPYSLEMIARVNGEEWSRGNSSSMTHSFEFAIAHLSRGKNLYPGDILGSGTVLSGSGFELGRSLGDGAVVELEIERLGTLTNTLSYT
ncbi:fumarylacetoacetate hydrolase family protein [Mycobacterium sp. NPDC003449]